MLTTLALALMLPHPTLIALKILSLMSLNQNKLILRLADASVFPNLKKTNALLEVATVNSSKVMAVAVAVVAVLAATAVTRVDSNKVTRLDPRAADTVNSNKDTDSSNKVTAVAEGAKVDKVTEAAAVKAALKAAQVAHQIAEITPCLSL